MTGNKNIKPRLDDIPKTNPFDVPERYFDTFQERMAERIVRTERRKAHSPALLWNRKRLIPILAVASMALVVALGVLLYHPNKTITLSDSELAEVYKYSALSEMTDAELVNQIEQINQELNLASDTITIKNDNFTNEAIDYLSNDDVDVNTLINAL